MSYQPTKLKAGFERDTGTLHALHNYVRFFLHLLLPNLHKVLYLDVDIVVKRDLRELWSVNIPNLESSNATACAVIRPSSPLFQYIPGILYPHMPTL